MPLPGRKAPTRAHVTFVAIIFLVLAGFFANCLVTQPVFSSRHWPTAQGTVLSARWVSTGKSSHLRVETSYEVTGMKYVCHHTDWADSGRFGLGSLSAGQSVAVWYDPSHPGQCVLQPGFTTGMGFRMLEAAFLLALGLFMLRKAKNMDQSG